MCNINGADDDGSFVVDMTGKTYGDYVQESRRG